MPDNLPLFGISDTLFQLLKRISSLEMYNQTGNHVPFFSQSLLQVSVSIPE